MSGILVGGLNCEKRDMAHILVRILKEIPFSRNK
jgi:hypothetical protein